jgi:RNA polymerase sigma factor (sigma-70 family)|tara:strand:+ start:393 stop:1157 length:765 start_codon:yes stop_codon:yes gene_type:complete
MDYVILKELDKYPVLKKEEAYKLIKVFQDTGCMESRNLMIKHNMGMVFKISGKIFKGYKVKHLEMDDLISEGVEGLIKAIAKFDLTTGYAFSTYAYFWVHDAIQRGMLCNENLIRVPIHAHDAITAANKIDSDKEDSGIIKSAILAKKCISSLDDEDCFDQMVSRAPSPFDVLSTNQNNKIVHDILNILNSNEKTVIHYRFGINTPDCLTLAEIGFLLDVSRERIRQIEVKAIQKMYKHIEENKIKSSLMSKAS